MVLSTQSTISCTSIQRKLKWEEKKIKIMNSQSHQQEIKQALKVVVGSEIHYSPDTHHCLEKYFCLNIAREFLLHVFNPKKSQNGAVRIWKGKGWRIMILMCTAAAILDVQGGEAHGGQIHAFLSIIRCCCAAENVKHNNTKIEK